MFSEWEHWEYLYGDPQRWQRWQAEDLGHEEWADYCGEENRKYRERMGE